MIYRTTVIDFEAEDQEHAEHFDGAVRAFLERPIYDGAVKVTHVKQSDRTPARAISTREIEHVAEKLLLDRGSFYWQVLMLTPRADVVNLELLRTAWPWLVEAVERWHATNPEDDVDYSDLIRARHA